MKRVLTWCVSPRRVLVIVAGIFLAFQARNLCLAQVVNGFEQQQEQEILASNARCSIISSNKVMLAGSTNLIRCRLQNISKNQLISLNTRQWLVTFTNGPFPNGPIHFSVGELELPRQPQARESHHLETGETYDWDERVVISNNIKPGHYLLDIWISVQMPALTNRFAFNPTAVFSYDAEQDLEVVK